MIDNSIILNPFYVSYHNPLKIKQPIKCIINRVSKRVGGFVRVSKKGTPHIIVRTTNMVYSIVYFKRTNSFRIHYPYPSNNNSQFIKDFKTENDLEEYFGGLA